MNLTPEELARLTRRDKPKAQARVLRALGIPFREHPFDAALLVSRTAAEAALGVTVEEASAKEPTDYEVNIAGIRAHGKTPASH